MDNPHRQLPCRPLIPKQRQPIMFFFDDDAVKASIPDSKYNLKVVIEPSSTVIRVNHESTYPPKSSYITVVLKVENPTASEQDVGEWYCNWVENWKISNPEITYVDWFCGSDGQVIVKIPPGGELRHELKMYVPYNVVPWKKLSFRMGFIPDGSTQIFLSNEVELHVIDDPPFSILIPAIVGAILGIALIWWVARLAFQTRSRNRGQA